MERSLSLFLSLLLSLGSNKKSNAQNLLPLSLISLFIYNRVLRCQPSNGYYSPTFIPMVHLSIACGSSGENISFLQNSPFHLSFIFWTVHVNARGCFITRPLHVLSYCTILAVACNVRGSSSHTPVALHNAGTYSGQ